MALCKNYVCYKQSHRSPYIVNISDFLKEGSVCFASSNSVYVSHGHTPSISQHKTQSFKKEGITWQYLEGSEKKKEQNRTFHINFDAYLLSPTGIISFLFS